MLLIQQPGTAFRQISGQSAALIRRWLLAVTYYDAVILTENHFRFVILRHIRVKHLVIHVYKFRVHVY